MADIYLRPRFNKSLHCNSDDVFSKIRESLEHSTSDVRGSIFRNSCVLKVPEAAVHFWSPQLHLSIEPEGETETAIHGMYGPRPSVWSVFVALYVGIGFIGTMGLIFGLSKWSLGDPATALWFGPAAIAAAAAIYAVGRVGRRIGMDQMIQLRDFMDDAVKDCIS